MSRIRTIKPEFWSSEQIVSCSPLARLLFIGLWNFCDDNGVHPSSYVRLKAEVFPVDSFTVDEIKKLVGELISVALIREYTVDEKTYWIVTGWKQHQRIEKPTYRHPIPLSSSKSVADTSSNTLRGVNDDAAVIPLIADDASITDRKGMDSNGMEKETGELEASHVCLSVSTPLISAHEVFSHWQQVMNHPRAKLDKTRERKIVQALKLGYDVNELKLAIDGCARTPYNMGLNDAKQRYDDIELVLRDASHIEKFISHAVNPPVTPQHDEVAADLMMGAI